MATCSWWSSSYIREQTAAFRLVCRHDIAEPLTPSICFRGVSNRAFAVFNCRRLAADLRVMYEDYSVDCGTGTHVAFQLLAAAIALCFSAGVPVALIAMMMKRARAHDAVTKADRFVARRCAEELQLDDRVAIDAIRDVSMGREYSFLVSAYQPRYFYWEGLDMIRKLSMVGLLVVAGQGSLSQIFIGLCLSVSSLGAQIRCALHAVAATLQRKASTHQGQH